GASGLETRLPPGSRDRQAWRRGGELDEDPEQIRLIIPVLVAEVHAAVDQRREARLVVVLDRRALVPVEELQPEPLRHLEAQARLDEVGGVQQGRQAIAGQGAAEDRIAQGHEGGEREALALARLHVVIARYELDPVRGPQRYVRPAADGAAVRVHAPAVREREGGPARVAVRRRGKAADVGHPAPMLL